MDKCKANAWSTKNEVATMVVGKFAYTKVKHSTKQKALFLFLVMCIVNIYKNREVYASEYKAESGYGIGVKPSTIMTT